jgi:hypothetical protein
MGSCNCKGQLTEVGTTTFPENYAFPPTTKHYDIETGCFTDIWDAISDWSNKNTPAKEVFKRLLHTYMQVNVCYEPHIILIYNGQTWAFTTRYNTGSNKYRVITL